MPSNYRQSNSYLIEPDAGGNYSDFGPKSPGWLIGGIKVDNPTNNWYQIKETGDFIPPYTVGWTRDFRPTFSSITLLIGIAATLFPTAADVIVVTLYEISPESPDVTVGDNNGISAPLTVQGTVIITGPVTISGTVSIAGTVTVSGTVSISGPVTINGSVTITSGTVDIGTVSGTVTITGSVTVSNTVNVSVTNSISVSSVGGTVSVIGSVTVSGSVSITGSVNIGTVAGTVTIAGAVTISGTPSVTIASGSVSITGSVTVGTITAGTVNVNPGTFTLGGQGDAAINTTGTAFQLSTSSVPTQVVMLKAFASNAGVVYVGKSTVTNTQSTAGNRSTTSGLQLNPGDIIVFPATNLNAIYLNGTSGDGVSYIYWT